MKYVTSEIASSEGSMAKSGSIDWNDFNYPCCLKIFHFDADETPEIHKKRVLFLRINHIILIFVNFLNIIANIAGTAQGVEDGGLRIGISFFLFFFWLPVSFYLFFLPYHIIMKDEGKPIIFYAMSFFAGIWFFIWSIANFADCNGFVMVSDNFAADRGAAGGIGIVVALGSLLVCILAFANGLFFYRR